MSIGPSTVVNDRMSAVKTSNSPSGPTRTRPCDACRRRKSKCVTEPGKSICVLCNFHSQACTYLQAPQPRKRPTVHGTAADGSGAKRNRTIRTKPGTGIEEYDTLPGPSLLKRTLGLQNKHHSELVGLHAVSEFFLDMGEPTGTDSSSKADYIRLVNPSVAFRIKPDSDTIGYEQELDDIEAIEAIALKHGPELVQLYFRIIHPSFPVLHKEVWLEKHSRSYREFNPPLLAAVYLLASVYWSYSETLAKTKKIDTSALQRLAFSTLHNAMRRPKLSTIQAGLLLSQYHGGFAGQDSSQQRDQLIVQLVSLSQSLGIHLDCSDWDIPDWEVGVRRRIGWALYMQDKWTSLLEGRPSLISEEDWAIEPLQKIDFPEFMEDEQEGSSEVERGRVVFMSMAELSTLLAALLRNVFSAKARRSIEAAPDRLGTLLSQIKPLQIQLRDWSSSLPESLRMDTAASMKLSSVGYLRLAWLAVEVCIHRTIIRTLLATDQPDPTVAAMCRGAAMERFHSATEFVGRLQAQHLASFWYFTSARCCALFHSFGQILGASAPSDEELALYSRKLKEFKWALKVNSEAGASFMKHALAYIAHAQTARVVTQSQDAGSTTTSPASVGYSIHGPSPQLRNLEEQQQRLAQQQQQHLEHLERLEQEQQPYHWTPPADFNVNDIPYDPYGQGFPLEPTAYQDANGMYPNQWNAPGYTGWVQDLG